MQIGQIFNICIISININIISQAKGKDMSNLVNDQDKSIQVKGQNG